MEAKITFTESAIRLMIAEYAEKEGKRIKEFYRIEAGGVNGGRHPNQHLFLYVEGDVEDLEFCADCGEPLTGDPPACRICQVIT